METKNVGNVVDHESAFAAPAVFAGILQILIVDGEVDADQFPGGSIAKDPLTIRYYLPGVGVQLHQSADVANQESEVPVLGEIAVKVQQGSEQLDDVRWMRNGDCRMRVKDQS